MTDYRKLNKEEKGSRYSNMKARCGKEYQDRNPRYYGTYMCDEWLENRKAYYRQPIQSNQDTNVQRFYWML